MELAEHFFKDFTNEEKINCLKEATRLSLQVMIGYGLGEPYYLVLDNDILNALEKPNIYKVRYVALIIFFRVLEAEKQEYRVAISPLIFFEFNGDEAFQTEIAFKEAMDKTNRVVLKTGLPIYSSGLSSFKLAKKGYKSIKHDLKLINAELSKIKLKNWEVDLRKGSGFVFPSAIARRECPDIKTKYFSVHHTKLFLESVIENKILHNKRNDKEAIKRFKPKKGLRKAKLLEVTNKGKVRPCCRWNSTYF